MKAPDICRHAALMLSSDREDTHGDKTINHKNIAIMWDAFMRIRKDPVAPISPLDVSLMMGLLKTARTQLGDHNPDDYLDMVGYAAIAGELAEGEK